MGGTGRRPDTGSSRVAGRPRRHFRRACCGELHRIQPRSCGWSLRRLGVLDTRVSVMDTLLSVLDTLLDTLISGGRAGGNFDAYSRAAVAGRSGRGGVWECWTRVLVRWTHFAVYWTHFFSVMGTLPSVLDTRVGVLDTRAWQFWKLRGVLARGCGWLRRARGCRLQRDFLNKLQGDNP